MFILNILKIYNWFILKRSKTKINLKKLNNEDFKHKNNHSIDKDNSK